MRKIALPSSERSKAFTQVSCSHASGAGQWTQRPSSGRRQWRHWWTGVPGRFARQSGHVTSAQLVVTAWLLRAPPHSEDLVLWTIGGKLSILN